MKTFSKLNILFLLITISAVLLSSCQYGEEQENDEGKSKIEEMRKETLSRYDELTNEIDRHVEEINGRLEEASDEAREGLENTREALLDERSKLERAMVDVQEASLDTWDEVTVFADNTYEAARDGVNSIIEDAREWME
jgi:CHASE3 domain sensor protein